MNPVRRVMAIASCIPANNVSFAVPHFSMRYSTSGVSKVGAFAGHPQDWRDMAGTTRSYLLQTLR